MLGRETGLRNCQDVRNLLPPRGPYAMDCPIFPSLALEYLVDVMLVK